MCSRNGPRALCAPRSGCEAFQLRGGRPVGWLSFDNDSLVYISYPKRHNPLRPKLHNYVSSVHSSTIHRRPLAPFPLLKPPLFRVSALTFPRILSRRKLVCFVARQAALAASSAACSEDMAVFGLCVFFFFSFVTIVAVAASASASVS